MSQMEKEGIGEESSACSAVFFWRISGGIICNDKIEKSSHIC